MLAEQYLQHLHNLLFQVLVLVVAQVLVVVPVQAVVLVLAQVQAVVLVLAQVQARYKLFL
uniref:Uncharacterized protein n=1 Tax=viral metagenome TaxID=1070528 RepID=A0A6C0AW34_9ZZZZ